MCSIFLTIQRKRRPVLISQRSHVQDLHFKLLCMMGEVCDTIHHLLDGRRVRVMQGGHFGGPHYSLQHLAQYVARVHHSIGHVRHGGLSGQSISYKHQFVSAEDDEFSVSHEDARWLTGRHAAEECVHGIQQGDEVLLALLAIERQQLTIASRQTGPAPCRGRGRGVGRG